MSYEEKLNQHGRKMEQMNNFNQAQKWYEKCQDKFRLQRVTAKISRKEGL